MIHLCSVFFFFFKTNTLNDLNVFFKNPGVHEIDSYRSCQIYQLFQSRGKYLTTR